MKTIDLNHLGEKWLELKKQRMQNLLKIALTDEALYREIMISLGYSKNKVNFLELAIITPYSEIRKLKEKSIIEKALLYRAGFIDDKNGLPDDFDFSLRMDKSVWIYKGIRPANFPEKRIEGISVLLSKTTECGLVNFFLERIKSEIGSKNLKKSLKSIMNFEGIGLSRKEEMFFNTIMPFMMVYSQDDEVQNFLRFMFENYPPLSENSLIKSFRLSYPEVKIENLKTYMGAILFQKTNPGQSS
ncbi:hypothetical protein Hydth_0290 [Hydrogenobacter thermophilus TK-6]|uniref:DUF2851 family protein n=1 Tax=Hydrogenobacter thermophilus TaxID=940 RepID=UPI0001E65664|nr:DUF2851 family protein [Hydrogenobacter thermophilus]ADO44694.1 hypothetical protein Hydth_0290 [Hydrogenobacter thermophilus TK-6]